MKRILYFGAAALGFLFTACQSDELTPENGQTDRDGEKTYYVNMRISGDPSSMNSRGSQSNGNPDAVLKDEDGNEIDFAKGDENEIASAYFVFYNNDGYTVGNLVQIDLKNLTADETVHGETVEKCYHSTVAVTSAKGDKPTYVICYINPIEPNGLMMNLSDIQTVTRDAIYKKSGGKRYFAMSNSVYYPTENEGSEPQVAVKIDDDALYSSQGEAEAAFKDDTKKVIDVYVERYASKLKFKSNDPEVYITGTNVYNDDNTDTNPIPVKLTFVPKYWAVNAMADKTYVTKSFREESSIGDILINNYSYDRLNGIINSGISENQWDWNNATYHRSYWAMSPAYFQDKYPDVTFDLDYISDIKQTYLPYNKLGVQGTPSYAVTDDPNGEDKQPHYFKETTVGSMALASSNPNAAVASVIYVGQYTLQVGDGEPMGHQTFYTYMRNTINVGGVDYDHPFVYFDDKPGLPTESVVEGGESMLKRMLDKTTILYRRVGTGTSSDSFDQLKISNQDDMEMFIQSGLSVSEVSYDVKVLAGGGTEEDGNPLYKLRNNARALQFPSTYTSVVEQNDNGEDVKGGIYIVTQNGYKKIVADNKTNKAEDEVGVSEANLALLRQVGLAYKYDTGLAYFSIPIKHLGWYRAGNTQKASTKIDWNKVRVGDFGLVRNHSYSIEVETITGLADGIGDPNAPIVPPSTSEDYFIAYAVRILKWAVVPTQKVTL